MLEKDLYIIGQNHRYLMFTRWCIPHCRQVKIEARSQALVVPTVDTEHDNLCILYSGNGQS